MPNDNLKDAVVAFTFSRKPREVRIATILSEILKNTVVIDAEGLSTTTLESAISYDDLLRVSTELAQYSVKDFAVRYGHLEDGNGKA